MIRIRQIDSQINKLKNIDVSIDKHTDRLVDKEKIEIDRQIDCLIDMNRL